MLVSDLQEELALHVHDVNNGEVTSAQWLMFINSAARDARTSGWLVRQTDDTSIEVSASTYEYDIPAGFAYIQELYIEETINQSSVYVREIPRSHWDVRLNASTGNPELAFNTLSELTPSKHIRIIGQKRPTIYISPTQTIDAGMEGFIRERALYYGYRFLGAGLSELSKWRQDMAKMSFTTAESMLHRQPQEMRELPNSTEVPGRG